MLHHNHTLTYLNVSDNEIQTPGAEAFADAVRTNPVRLQWPALAWASATKGNVLLPSSQVFSMLKYEDNDITEFGRVTLHAALNPADEKAQEALEKVSDKRAGLA